MLVVRTPGWDPMGTAARPQAVDPVDLVDPVGPEETVAASLVLKFPSEEPRGPMGSQTR